MVKDYVIYRFEKVKVAEATLDDSTFCRESANASWLLLHQVPWSAWWQARSERGESFRAARML